jgi:hypothetical protein
MNLFELYLTPLNAKDFRVMVTHSTPALDGGADSTLPFWDGEQDWRTTIIKTLESNGFRSDVDVFPRTGERDWMANVAQILSEDGIGFHPDYLKHIGQFLYTALLPTTSPVRDAFQTAMRFAEQADTELHLRLKFPADVGKQARLADYPWELLHDGQRFLQHRQVFVSRYIAYEALPPALSPQRQLRVLLISPQVEDATQGLAKLSDAEQQAIRRGLSKAESEGSIVLESLPKASLKALSTNLSQRAETDIPQVLHFDGHGLFGKRCANPHCNQIHTGTKVKRCRNCGQQLPEPTGFLLFEDEQGKPDYVSAASLAAFLPRGVALVVLSACQSGMAIAGESVFSGTAQQLIDARVPAVVAMQYAVSVDAASQFAEQFYRVLGQKKPLVIALNEGRKWMGVDGNQWYRPVLYLRWLDNQGGQVFAESSVQAEPNIPALGVEPKLPEQSIEAGNPVRPAQVLKLQYLQNERTDLEQQLDVVQSELKAIVDVTIKAQYENRLDLLFKQIEQVDQDIQKVREGR